MVAKACCFFLTNWASSGSLCLLLPQLFMEHNSRLKQAESIAQPSQENRLERQKLSFMARMARSSRAKVAAALLAVGGGVMQADKAEASEMLPAIVAPASEVTWDAERFWGIDNYLGGGLDIGHGDNNNGQMETASWISLEISDDLYNQGYEFDTAFPLAANEGIQVIGVDQIANGLRNRVLLLIGDIDEGDIMSYAISVNNGTQGINLEDALVNAKVKSGHGPLTGTVTSLDDALSMTDGPILVGQYSDEAIAHDDFSVFAQLPNTQPILGDYNSDGVVDEADRTAWVDNFGSTTDLAADGNGNGIIDAADFTVWRDNVATASASESNAIPEPNTALLVGAGIAAGALATRRRLRDVSHS